MGWYGDSHFFFKRKVPFYVSVLGDTCVGSHFPGSSSEVVIKDKHRKSLENVSWSYLDWRNYGIIKKSFGRLPLGLMDGWLPGFLIFILQSQVRIYHFLQSVYALGMHAMQSGCGRMPSCYINFINCRWGCCRTTVFHGRNVSQQL